MVWRCHGCRRYMHCWGRLKRIGRRRRLLAGCDEIHGVGIGWVRSINCTFIMQMRHISSPGLGRNGTAETNISNIQCSLIPFREIHCIFMCLLYSHGIGNVGETRDETIQWILYLSYFCFCQSSPPSLPHISGNYVFLSLLMQYHHRNDHNGLVVQTAYGNTFSAPINARLRGDGVYGLSFQWLPSWVSTYSDSGFHCSFFGGSSCVPV